jgi:hypothetical protein
VFPEWVTSDEHKWVIFRERRGQRTLLRRKEAYFVAKKLTSPQRKLLRRKERFFVAKNVASWQKEFFGAKTMFFVTLIIVFSF